MADKARNWTDKKLNSMEKRIKGIYKDAQGEITEKWNKYMAEGENRLKSLRDAFISASDEDRAKAKEAYEHAVRNYTLNNARYKELVDETTLRLANTNQIALSYVNDQIPDIYAKNFAQVGEDLRKAGIDFKGKNGSSIRQIVNEDTVKKMIKEGDVKTPFMRTKKYLNIPKDQRWNTKKINSQVLQGILQGESMNKIADRLLPIVNNNASASIRNARTLVTGAENGGRFDSYHRLEDEGVIMKKVWIATGDDRTREWHLTMDGQEVDIDEDFVDGNDNHLAYPADPSGEPETVYNCRCSMRTHIVGFRKADGSIEEVDYEDKGGESAHERSIREEQERRGIEPNVIQTTVQETNVAKEPEAIKLPEDFFKPKQAEALTSFLDTVQGKDADVAELYGTIGDMLKESSYPMKVSYTAKNHAITPYSNRFTGEISKVTVQIPKMDGDLLSQSETTIHELGHLTDLLYGKNDFVSATNTELKNAILNGNPMSDDVKSLFEQLKANGDEAYKNVMVAVRERNQEFNNQISEAYKKKDWGTAYDLSKERDKAWKQGMADAVSAMRAEHKGYEGLEDIYDALSGGKLQSQGYFGHGTKYYSSTNSKSAETFANYCAMSQTNPKALQILQNEQPEIYNACRNMVKEMLGRGK